LTTWLNTPIQMQFRTIDGLSIRYAESPDQHNEHALLLSLRFNPGARPRGWATGLRVT
jgi:hypothetical protein